MDWNYIRCELETILINSEIILENPTCEEFSDLGNDIIAMLKRYLVIK